MTLVEKIRRFPRRPGVYLMKDSRAVVLYVGKAKDLRARVGSYFRRRGDGRYQIRFLMRRVADIECVVTDTEKEALLLEHTLIHRHHPRYNIFFRDDKAFVSIRLTSGHPFPGMYLTRRVTQDGSTYFGPYTSSQACRATVEQIAKFFKLRTCRDQDFANRARPCIQYQIGRCTAPCVGYVDRAAYARQVEDAAWLLSGRRSELVRRLTTQMRDAASAERFEEAGRLRDCLRDIAATVEPQKVVRHATIDRDYIGWATEAGPIPKGIRPSASRAAIAVLEVRDGKVVGRVGTVVELGTDRPAELVESFLVQYYTPPRRPPPIVCAPFPPEQFEALRGVLRERAGAAPQFLWPRRGAEARLLKLAAVNAMAHVRTQRTEAEQWETLAAQCRRALHLPALPTMMTCVDISNWQGASAVGAVVTFVEGQPAKSRYRRYRIRAAAGPDDYAMMREVLARHLAHPEYRPDCLVVDGGRGQLAIAQKVVADLTDRPIPLAAIAKPTITGARAPSIGGAAPSKLGPVAAPPIVEREMFASCRWHEFAISRPPTSCDARTGHRTPQRLRRCCAAWQSQALRAGSSRATTPSTAAETFDKVYLPGRKNPLNLKPGNPVLLLLQRLRDEAHRFGITHVRRQTAKTSLQSVLATVPGIGPARQRALLQRFGDLDGLRRASIAQLAQVSGISPTVAERILERMRDGVRDA